MPETKRLYYFTPTKYGLKAVKHLRLKTAELDKVNDPYELLPFQPKNNISDEAFQRIKNNLSKTIKIVCLSKTYHNPSLWGHYADKGKGICLGFDIKKDNSEILLEKIKYTKDKLTTSFGDSWVDGELSIDDINNHNFYKDMRRHKSHHWKHEKEWRTWTVAKDLELDPITGFYFLHFGLHFESPLRLRKILIGPRSEEENIKSNVAGLKG